MHRAAETALLPVNRGVAKGDTSKEHQWAGPTDRSLGEFYKKMNTNQKKVAKEAILFYNSWNIWRKVMYSATIVFFDDYFRF